MDRDQRYDDQTSEAAASAVTTARSATVAARYPRLAQRLSHRDAPSMADAATAAVEGKDAGQPVEAGIARRVGDHLGVELDGVRVHQDGLAQEASAAIGARAFAYGSDVFLGADESASDVSLMAHELTHVAQQGGASQRAPQRRVEVGASDSPAEAEADRVAADVVAGNTPAEARIVDEGPVQAGQMLKSEFLAALREAVSVAADAELGPAFSGIGCPYIDQTFGRYALRSARDGEALLRRFAPEVQRVTDAHAMIPLVVARVLAGIRTWQTTGAPPPELAAADPSAATAATAESPVARALRAPDGSESLASLEAELGDGRPLPGSDAARMGAALGADVSGVRIHDGPAAARKATEHGALAFAAGQNVVLGAGAPAAGTIESDALLAHELAHTVQQRDASADPTARRQPLAEGDRGVEADADHAAEGAVTGARTGWSSWARAPLALSRCTPSENPAARAAAAARIRGLLAHPDANASAIAAEIRGIGNPRDRARTIRELCTSDPAAFCTDLGNYDQGGVILTAMRDGIESRVGEGLLERTQFDAVRTAIDAAITARTSAAPTAVVPDLARLNAALGPDLGNARYTTGAARITLPAEMFPGAAAARNGHVYFDPALRAASATATGESGVTNTGVWSTSGTVYNWHAGYIRIGVGALSTDAHARETLFHEWSHYAMQIERQSAMTDPDLIAIRDDLANGHAAQADANEHMIIISRQIEEYGDTVGDAELGNSIWYLQQKWAAATARYHTIAIDRIVAWARVGAATAPPRRGRGRPAPARTARQRRVLTAIDGLRGAGLPDLRTAVDVTP